MSIHTILAVTEFTKKTGDYRSLSATDIRVLALTYQLEKRHVGVDHIRTVPDRKVGDLTVTLPADSDVEQVLLL